MQICWTLTWDSWKGWHWGQFGTIQVTTVDSTLAVHATLLLTGMHWDLDSNLQRPKVLKISQLARQVA